MRRPTELVRRGRAPSITIDRGPPRAIPRAKISGSYSQAPHWNVDITVYDPHGRYAAGDYFYDAAPGSTGTTYLCVPDESGTYRVSAEYETYDSDYNQTAASTVTTSFTVSTKAKYASTVRDTKTKYAKHGWKVAGRLTNNGKAWAGHRVQIQAYVSGSWRNMLTKKTNRYGRVVFTSKPRPESLAILGPMTWCGPHNLGAGQTLPD